MGPGGPRTGCYLLCTDCVHSLQDCGFLAFCPLVGEAVQRLVKVSWRAGPLPAYWRGKLSLGPLVGSAMSRGRPRGGGGLRTSLLSCLMMGGAVSCLG